MQTAPWFIQDFRQYTFFLFTHFLSYSLCSHASSEQYGYMAEHDVISGKNNGRQHTEKFASSDTVFKKLITDNGQAEMRDFARVRFIEHDVTWCLCLWPVYIRMCQLFKRFQSVWRRVIKVATQDKILFF